MNHSAAVAWCLMAEGADEDAVARELAARFAIPLETARADLNATLAAFREAGILPGGEEGGCAESKGAEGEASRASSDQERGGGSSPGGEWRHGFQLPNLRLQVQGTDQELLQAYRRLMEPFQTAADGAADSTLASVQGDYGHSTYTIYRDGQARASAENQNDALLALISLTFSAAVAALAERILLHGAVLGRDKRAFLFLGPAGSGKTTLAAFGGTRGYRLLADEVAVIDPGSGLLTALPLPMTIKRGAWPVLRGIYPQLDGERAYHRADGKEVKFLVPPGSCRDLATRYAPAGLIFPCYEPSAAAEARALPKAEAMRRLVATCSSDRPLTDADIRAMVRLVDGCPCHELRYGSCEEGYRLFDALLTAGEGKE